jgi:hypothetical protein
MRRIMVFIFAMVLSAEVVWGAPVIIDPGLSVRQVVAGLSAPTTMAFIGANDFLVLQKNDGRVRRVTAGMLQSAAVLDLDVDGQSERGLLGIALHPDFPVSAFVYLYFTKTSSGDGSGNGTANRVYRYSWNGSTLATPGTLIADLPISPGALRIMPAWLSQEVFRPTSLHSLKVAFHWDSPLPARISPELRAKHDSPSSR